MAAGLVVPIAGAYTGTWNSLSFGTLSDDGYELQCTHQGQEVNETDAYGMTLVEAIYRGQNWRARLRGLEYKQGLISVLQNFGAVSNTGVLAPVLGSIGTKWTSSAEPMVLTSILGSPPTAPATLTATNAAFAPNAQSAFNMTSKVREIPLEMVLFPYLGSGSGAPNIPFSTT